MDNPFNMNCIYCNEKLVFNKIDKILDITFKDLEKRFNGHKIEMENIHGNFSEKYFKIISGLIYEETHHGYCLACGWWKIIEEYWMAAEWQIWQVFFEVVGTLRNFDLKSSEIPLNEVRSHLIRHYKDRFYIHPKIFEEVVADIYKDYGYNAICTGYSKDGGIDVILSKDNKTIGVQVKRTKNNIKVEQIRALLGSLLINNYQSGIFISTSNFQRGANTIGESNSIELVSGDKFYNKLKEAQIIKNKSNTFDLCGVTNLFYCGCYEMNSL